MTGRVATVFTALLGGALAAISVGKIAALVDDPQRVDPGAWLGHGVVALLELAICVFLLMAATRRAALVAATGLLSGIAVYRLVHVASGQAAMPCRCFGNVRIDEWQALLVTGGLLAVAGLALASSRSSVRAA